MKRIISLLIVLSLMCVTTGCSDRNSNASSNNNENENINDTIPFYRYSRGGRKMKVVKAIVCIVLVVLLLTSCANSNIQVDVYSLSEFGKDDTIIEYKSEFPYYYVGNDESINEQAVKTNTFLFLGEKYVLTYDHSLKKEFNPYFEDIYTSKDNVSFGFNAETGELTSVLSSKGINQSIIENPVSEEDFRKVADALLTEYMNTSEYEVSIVTEISERKEVDGITEGGIRKYDEFRETENGKYYFTYNRKYGELKTGEFALVTMDNYGKILTLQLNSIGAFKSNDGTILSYDEACKLFSEKIKKCYKRNIEIAVNIQTIMACKTQDDIPYYVTSLMITPDQAGAQDFESIICVFMVQ